MIATQRYGKNEKKKTLLRVSDTLQVCLDREKVIWTWKADGHKKQLVKKQVIVNVFTLYTTEQVNGIEWGMPHPLLCTNVSVGSSKPVINSKYLIFTCY